MMRWGTFSAWLHAEGTCCSVRESSLVRSVRRLGFKSQGAGEG